MWKHLASNALTLIIALLFVIGGAIAWGNTAYNGAGPLESGICFQVEDGGTMSAVSRQLAEAGAISSPAVFRIGTNYAGLNSQLKAGSFLLPEGATMAQIAEQITTAGANTCGTEVVYRIGVTRTSVQVRELDPASGEYVVVARFNPVEDTVPEAYRAVRADDDTRYRLTIAEGVTSWQVVTSLTALDVLDGTVDETPPEGSLAPDSYAFTPGDTVASVVLRMTEAQSRILADAWSARTDGLPLETPEEALILASIIEKETAQPEERRQVASVFVNRLRRGMQLQTDPTVIYGITQGEGVLGRGLRQSELRRETPWNTYVIPALPPTPIANPGAASIAAALDPDSTDYIFFVADGTGGHAFATNLDDHNRNVAVWRKIEAEQAADQ